MKKLLSLVIILGGMIFPTYVQASGKESTWYAAASKMDFNQVMLLLILVLVVVLLLLLVALLLYLLSFISAVMQKETPALADQPSWWSKFKERFLTGKLDEVGGKEEEAKKMSDHAYDGITELDNFMPPWLQWVFLGSIGFAFVYFVQYSVMGTGLTGAEEYQEELAQEALAAETRKASQLAGIDETTVVFDTSESALKTGKSIFESNCAACHAADGGGGVGPNLTDSYWLHGGTIQDVFKVIKVGVVEKGMVPWQDQLSPEEIQQVASYILSLKGTTPASPKAPQGELVGENPVETPKGDSTQVIASN
ncbi:MAG: c-type cytochrome [Bacteroidetes bacterium]|nr:c-type cytochrome [Bacteroidota bacterium]